MILGEPGAGKSTLFKYLALISARALQDHEGLSAQEPRLPILIPLRRFAASAESLVEFFYTHFKKTYQLELSRGFFERALEEGRCIIFFDGLDEVFVSGQRPAVRDAVGALASRYPHNCFVISSRVVGYESAPLDRRAFVHHRILPFNENEIETFVQKWYAARERNPNEAKSKSEHLLKTFKKNDRLRKLAENPLMLTIIALVHRIEAELPNERVKLYDKCTEVLLSTWEGVKGLPLSERERDRPYYRNRRRLLEKLAFWMHTVSQEEERQAEVKRGDLKSKLIEFFVEDSKLNLSSDLAELEADALIELAMSRTGILVERGDGVYSFVHLTFQEYFAACDLEKRYITDLDRLWKEIQPHLYDPRWREVILLLIGRLNEHDEPPSVIVEKILRESDKFDGVLRRNLFLAVRCLADRVNIKESLRNEIREALVKLASASSPLYLPLQYQAIETLGTLYSDKHVGDALLGLANDKNLTASVRQAVLRVVGETGRADDVVIHALLKLAENEKEHYYVRRAVAQALGQLGRADDVVIQALLSLVENENVHAFVRTDAAQALGQLGHTNDAIRLLLVLAENEKVDESGRRAAAQALGQLGRTDDAIRLLLALADKEMTDKYEPALVANALGEFGQKNPRVALALLSLAMDKDEFVRSLSYDALNGVVGNLRYAEVATRYAVIKNKTATKGKGKSQIRKPTAKNKSRGSKLSPKS